MKKELDALLCERYPIIFSERNQSMQETCMDWDFTCGDGWFYLIDTLCERLQFWTDHNKAPQVVAVQVKEKLGSLRFYLRYVGSVLLPMNYWPTCRCSADPCQNCIFQ